MKKLDFQPWGVGPDGSCSWSELLTRIDLRERAERNVAEVERSRLSWQLKRRGKNR